MTDAERARKEARLREIEAELEKEAQMPARGPAGAFAEPVVTGEVPPPNIEPEGYGQKIAEFGVKAGASMAGATRGAAAVAPVAARVPFPAGKAAVTAGGAILGAATGGGAADLSIGGVKKLMSIPGAPDSVDDWLASGGEEFWNSGAGEFWGRTLIGIPMSKIAPYRRAVTPDSADRMKDIGARLRAAYEEIGGSPLLEDMRSRWNPGRIFRPFKTELDKSSVVRRLTAAGLDPEKAREVALTQGIKPSEVDAAVQSRYWAQISNTKVKPDLAYEQARAKLLHAASMDDFGFAFSQNLPPGQAGKAIHDAVWGRFDSLNGARKMALNALDEKLPKDFRLDMRAFKDSFGIRPNVKMGGVNLRLPASKAAMRNPAYSIMDALPDNPTFQEVQTARDALATLAKDGRFMPPAGHGGITNWGPQQEAEIKQLITNLDAATGAGLPKGYQAQFRKFTKADETLNKELLDGAFVGGLLRNKVAAREYAETIIKNRDVDNFRELERVLKKVPNGKQMLGSVRSAIAERFLSPAVVDGVVQPDRLMLGLGTQTKGYGRAFLDAVLGPEYGRNYIKFAKTMDQINDAARNAGGVTRGALTVAGAASGVAGMFRGAPGMGGAGVGATIMTALFSPAVLERALTSPTAGRRLLKVAEHVAAGRNPMTASRLAGRVLEEVGVAPEDFLQGWGILPSEKSGAAVRQQQTTMGQPPPATGMSTEPGA